jgi:DNA-binding MarR family transcriptional regulator
MQNAADIEMEERIRALSTEVEYTSTCLNLKKAARATSHILDEHLQPLGLRASQFSLLNAIARNGAATMTRLAELQVTDRTTLTRTLKPLERDGLVQITAGKDKRVREISLTAQGRALLERALPLREQAEKRIVEGLGTERWQNLLANLSLLTTLAGR